MTLDYNFFNILILSASIHGLIFSLVVLFSKKFNDKPNKLLAYYILLLSLNNIYFWFIDTNIVSYFGWNYYWLFPIQWDLLMFPALFYFISNYLGNSKAYNIYMYPFYVSFPFFVFFMFQQIFFKELISVDTISNFYVLMSYVSMLFSCIAIIHAFKLIYSYKRENQKTNQLKIEINWLEKLLKLLVLVLLLWVLLYTFNTLTSHWLDERKTSYVLWISMSFLIYWMGYLGIYHLGIFNQRKHLRTLLVSEKTNGENNDLPYTNPNKFSEIDTTIRQDRLYTDASISLSSLAEIFNISEGYLSQIINKNTNNNFSNYINDLRTKEAKRILKNPDYKNYTIVAIAFESGFNSKSAFYSAFKKSTGMSPVEYKKQHNMS